MAKEIYTSYLGLNKDTMMDTSYKMREHVNKWYSKVPDGNELNANNSINIDYKPILLGGLHKLSDITAPAFNERKMKNMKNDCELVAEKNDITFKWNNKFPINSLELMRGYLIVNEELKNKFFDLCFDAYWKYNIDLSNKENIKDILKKT